MTQAGNSPQRETGKPLRSSGGDKILIIAGILLAVLGTVGAVVSAAGARYSNGPLDIRGAIQEENGIFNSHDFAAASFWIVVTAVGIVLLIVGLVRRALRLRG
jgi:hypothetical protein